MPTTVATESLKEDVAVWMASSGEPVVRERRAGAGAGFEEAGLWRVGFLLRGVLAVGLRMARNKEAPSAGPLQGLENVTWAEGPNEVGLSAERFEGKGL